jgi:mannose-6-phosphate isomerase-like protein (cupin superfamily)
MAKPSEEFHHAAEEGLSSFKYEKPAPSARPKQLAWLLKGGQLNAAVQVVREGGENNLHYHLRMDSFYMVLKGGVRFFGVDEKLIGEYGPYEGILVPAGARYRFEKVGPEELELLQVSRWEFDGKEAPVRVNIEPHKEWMDRDDLRVYASESGGGKPAGGTSG